MEVVKCPPSCLALYHFDLTNIFISIGAPDRGRIFYQWALAPDRGRLFYQWAHQCLVSYFTDSWGFVRLINPRERFADVHIFWTWLLQVRLLLISTPKYLDPPAHSRIWPCCRYSLGTGVLARVTWMTTHLLGLNSMSHCNSHS